MLQSAQRKETGCARITTANATAPGTAARTITVVAGGGTA